MSNQPKCGRSRKIHLRLMLRNDSHDEGVVEYTLDEIKEYFAEHYNDSPAEIVIVLHDKDISEKDPNSLVNPHVHIMGCYPNGTSFEFKVIKERFPQITWIDQDYKESMFAYAIHANAPEKYQYSVDDLYFFGQLTKETYEEYVAFSKKKIAAKKEQDQKKNELAEKVKSLRLDLTLQNAADAEEKKRLEALYRTVRDGIWEGKITRRTYNDLIKNDSTYRNMHDKHHAKIDDTFKRRLAWMVDHYKERALKVWFVEGNGRSGKTALAEYICKQKGWSYSVSSEKNDMFQNVMEDDSVFIFNEVTDTMCKYRTFLRWTDPFVNPSVGSRFYNKNFFGHLIIITTPKTLDEWYSGEKMADGNYNGESTRKQFDGRISKVFKVRDNYIEEYDHHEDGTNTLVGKYLSPIVCRKQKNKEEKQAHPTDSINIQEVLDYEAECLEVADRYETYKASCNVDELTDRQPLQDKQGQLISEESVSFIFETAVKDMVDKGISRIDAINYLMDRLKFYSEPGVPTGDIIQLGGK